MEIKQHIPNNPRVKKQITLEIKKKILKLKMKTKEIKMHIKKINSFPSELAWQLVRRLIWLRFQFPQINLQFNTIQSKSSRLLGTNWQTDFKILHMELQSSQNSTNNFEKKKRTKLEGSYYLTSRPWKCDIDCMIL